MHMKLLRPHREISGRECNKASPTTKYGVQLPVFERISLQPANCMTEEFPLKTQLQRELRLS